MVSTTASSIQTDYGYHIILRIPVDREQVKADCTADYKLQQLTQQWMDEAVVETTQAYDELDEIGRAHV